VGDVTIWSFTECGILFTCKLYMYYERAPPISLIILPARYKAHNVSAVAFPHLSQ
jgi:hypothetical protein